MPALPPISTASLCPAAPALLRVRSMEIILSSVASAGCLLQLADLLAGLAHMADGVSCRHVTAAVVRDLEVVRAGRCACDGAGHRGAAAAVMMSRDKQSRSGSRRCHGI